VSVGLVSSELFNDKHGSLFLTRYIWRAGNLVLLITDLVQLGICAAWILFCDFNFSFLIYIAPEHSFDEQF